MLGLHHRPALVVGPVLVQRPSLLVVGQADPCEAAPHGRQPDDIADQVDLLVQVAHVGVVHHEAHHRVGHVARGLLEASVDGLRKIVE